MHGWGEKIVSCLQTSSRELRCEELHGDDFLADKAGGRTGDSEGVLHINVRHEVPRSLRVSFTWRPRQGMDDGRRRPKFPGVTERLFPRRRDFPEAPSSGAGSADYRIRQACRDWVWTTSMTCRQRAGGKDRQRRWHAKKTPAKTSI